MHHSQRRIIALCGSQAWCRQAAVSLLQQHDSSDIVWSGDTVPAELALAPFARRQQLLGDEYGIAVIDGWSGFDPDLFGALSGTVRGGGALLLLLPPLEEWPSRPDPAQQRIAVWPHTPATMPNHFIARTLRILRHHPRVEWHVEGEPLPAPLHPAATSRSAAPPFHTADQLQAIAAIHHVVHGHRRRPLVLMADRGRGKSAALGIAAAQLLAQGMERIIVTAPHRNAVTSLFRHAASTSPAAGAATQPLQFVPPDELLRHPHACDLLLVDEAAAIPAPMLEQLLKRHARIVFATTVHGYEGSGRGFALRFFKVLDRLTPGWRLLELQQPIRWAADDALERLTYQLLMLDAAPAADEAVSAAPAEEIRYESIDSRALTSDDGLLAELFGLLVLAHYRTTPLDLRLLLDSPNLTIHLARYRDHILATAITLREGGFDSELAAQIYRGERRPRGHLAAQSLAFHCGLREAPPLHTERIMRIAVHPAVQQRGIGSMLLAQLAGRAANAGIDYLSTSFGATPELLHFWQRNGFLPVRIGVTREASSGHHSALLLRPLSPAAMTLFARARRRFIDYLPLMLSEPLRDLEPELAALLLAGEQPDTTPRIDADDWRDLHSFAATQRSYEACLGALHKLAREVVANPLLLSELTPDEQRLLIAKVVQLHSWQEVGISMGVNGKEQAVKLLRRVIAHLLGILTPELNSDS